MRQYLDLLEHILTKGVKKENERTGTGTLAVFGYQLRFTLQEGFPLLTTKKIHLKSIIYELLWFLRGETNARWLQEHGVTIWDEWTDEDGNLGPVYGKQWRAWSGTNGKEYDQIARVINLIRTDPDNRRMIVSAWKVDEIEDMALPPCHLLFQFFVGGGKLSLQMYQRSVDTFLGLPFNIASYALLLMMVAQVTDYQPGELILTLGDTHLYLNHLEQVYVQLSREPRPLPQMLLDPSIRVINGFSYRDFTLVNYEPHPAIKAPISV